MSSDLLERKIQELNRELDDFVKKIYEIEDIDMKNEQIKAAGLYLEWLKRKTSLIKQEKNFTGENLPELKRGEVVLIELGFNVGEELGGSRPAIILRDSKVGHKRVLVLPITKNTPKDTIDPIYVKIGFIRGLRRQVHWANILNVKNISKQRIVIPPQPKRVDDGALNRISAAIRAQIALR